MIKNKLILIVTFLIIIAIFGCTEETKGTYEIKVIIDGENIDEVLENKIDSGMAEIKLIVSEDSNNLRIGTSNIILRNPAQSIGEGTNLNFQRNEANEYIANYDFKDKGKTYFLEGSYTLLDSGEIIALEKHINVKGGAGEEPVFDPLIMWGGFVIFAVVIIVTVILLKKRKKK